MHDISDLPHVYLRDADCTDRFTTALATQGIAIFHGARRREDLIRMARLFKGVPLWRGCPQARNLGNRRQALAGRFPSRLREEVEMRVIVSPQEDIYVAVRPGAQAGIQLPAAKYAELISAAARADAVPAWFVDAARQAWEIELARQPTDRVIAVRPASHGPVTYSRASWEINKGCNFSCEHCYLEQRPFAGLPLAEKLRLIDMLADMGVLWFQITGGEPLIDPDFSSAYQRAHDAGMMLEILTNGSRLARVELLGLFAAAPPHKIKVSMYGAGPETADALTQTRGAFKNTYRTDRSLPPTPGKAPRSKRRRLATSTRAPSSPAAPPDTRPSTSTRWASPRCARSAGTTPSTWSSTAPKGFCVCPPSQTPKCVAAGDAAAASSRPPAGYATPWHACTRKRRHHWKTTVSTAKGKRHDRHRYRDRSPPDPGRHRQSADRPHRRALRCRHRLQRRGPDHHQPARLRQRQPVQLIQHPTKLNAPDHRRAMAR
jgi:hypothetical protein